MTKHHLITEMRYYSTVTLRIPNRNLEPHSTYQCECAVSVVLLPTKTKVGPTSRIEDVPDELTGVNVNQAVPLSQCCCE